MKRNDWPVGLEDARPAGKPDRCFYCDAPMGAQHRMGCVTRQRTVLIRTVVTHVVKVPEDWDTHLIEFTEGSSCSSNLIQALNDLDDRLEDEGRCPCGMIEIEYAREATEEDEQESAIFIGEQTATQSGTSDPEHLDDPKGGASLEPVDK